MKTNHAFVLSTMCLILFVAVIAATPVGGWHPSNPHAEDYKFFFGISGMCLLSSIFLLAQAFKKEIEEDDKKKKEQEEQAYQLRKRCQDQALDESLFD